MLHSSQIEREQHIPQQYKNGLEKISIKLFHSYKQPSEQVSHYTEKRFNLATILCRNLISSFSVLPKN